MAERSLAIRLSLQDHEKVREALERLGPEGQKALQRIERASEPASRGLLAVNAASQQLQGGLHQLAGRAGPLGSILTSLGPAGLAAAAGMGALAGALAFVRRQAAAADQLQHVADRLGTTAEALQAFRFAADQAAGIAEGPADQAFRSFTQRVAEAQAGTGELKETLAQYAIALKDSDGRLRSTEAILGDLAAATAGAASRQEQLRIAAKAFGEEGSGLVNLLRQGRTGLAEWTEAAHRSGAVLGNDVVAQLAAANTEVGRLTRITETQLTVALADLSPILVGIAEGFAGVARFASDVYNRFLDLEDLSLRGLAQRREGLLSDLGTVTAEYAALNNQIIAFEGRGQTRAADAKREPLALLAAQAEALQARIAEVDRQIETLGNQPAPRPETALGRVGLPTPAQVSEVERAVARIAERAAAADLERQSRTVDTFAGYEAAVQRQVEREARARQDAAKVAADARTRAETDAGREIARAQEQRFREAERNARALADTLVGSGRRFLDGLYDESRDFWQSFADLARDTLLDIAADGLFRGPANAFAAGFFGTGTGGSGNAGSGAGGMLGSITQSVVGNAVSGALGLESLGSRVGSYFGFGSGAAGAAAGAAGSAGAFGGMSATAVEAAVASQAAGTGFLAAAAPFALPAAALAGAYLLSGGLDSPSVGPNAAARITFRNGRFVLGATGSDNGGESLLAQAEAEALAAAAVLNRAAETLGRSFDERRLHDIPDPGLATQAGDRFRRTGTQLAEEVLRSGALGDLTEAQIAAAIGGGNVIGAEIDAVLAAIGGSGTRDAQRAAERRLQDAGRLIEQAAQQELRSRQDLVAALARNADAALAVADGLREGVDDLLMDEARGLSPDRRLGEVQRQFDAAVAGGDADRALGLSDTLLEAGNAWFGAGSTGAVALFDRTVAALDGLRAGVSRQAASEQDALRQAQAHLATLERVESLTADQVAAAEATASAAREELTQLERQQAALDAIEAALGDESPDATILREQLSALERIGVGQDSVATSLRDLVTTLTTVAAAAVGAPVVAITGPASAADRFAAWAAEVEQMRHAARYAGGVDSAPAGWAWVGEQGPELMRMRGGEQVLPARASRALAGGSPDGVALLVEVRDLLRQNLRLSAETGNRQLAGLETLALAVDDLGRPLRRAVHGG